MGADPPTKLHGVNYLYTPLLRPFDDGEGESGGEQGARGVHEPHVSDRDSELEALDDTSLVGDDRGSPPLGVDDGPGGSAIFFLAL